MHKKQIEIIEQLALLATRRHYWCDDSYYTCPAHEEGCSNAAYEDTKECHCGADEHNAKVASLIAKLKENDLECLECLDAVDNESKKNDRGKFCDEA